MPHYNRSMSIDPAKLRDEALRVPIEDRARLVAELLGSLDGIDDVDEVEHEHAWSAEIVERLRQVDADEVQPIPRREARQRIARE